MLRRLRALRQRRHQGRGEADDPGRLPRYSEDLKPGVCQLSGGEPLLRDDLEDIVRAVKRPNGLPMVVLVSNWWLMTEETVSRSQ